MKLKVAVGFQSIQPELAQQIISQFKEAKKEVKVEPEHEVPLHKEIKQKLVEIGKLQRYLAEEEYPFDLGRLDVVWRRIERSVPTYVFEVQIGGDPYHALAKLKHAFDLWNSRIFIVGSQAEFSKIMSLLGGTFHEISERVKFWELENVEELYKRKRAYLDFEKELGI